MQTLFLRQRQEIYVRDACCEIAGTANDTNNKLFIFLHKNNFPNNHLSSLYTTRNFVDYTFSKVHGKYIKIIICKYR